LEEALNLSSDRILNDDDIAPIRMGPDVATPIHRVGYRLEEYTRGCFVYYCVQTGSGPDVAIPIHRVGYGLEEYTRGCFVYYFVQTVSGPLIAI
jgi:hypothetical protein